jgi:hypothetical protein
VANSTGVSDVDSEQMTETERTLTAAVRSVCVAIMHQAAGGA